MDTGIGHYYRLYRVLEILELGTMTVVIVSCPRRCPVIISSVLRALPTEIKSYTVKKITNVISTPNKCNTRRGVVSEHSQYQNQY